VSRSNPAIQRGRREFLAGCGCAALAGLGGLTCGALAQASEPRLIDLGDGLAQIVGAGGNVLALANASGLLLVDTGGSAASSAVAALLADRFPGAAVTTILNTHWHPEHTGGNDALADADTRIVAHENTRLWMSTKFYVDWEDRHYLPRAPAALPNDTFVASDAQPLTIDFGGETLRYGQLEQAHTDGDIYVYFPQRNLIAAGGTVTDSSYPVLDYVTGGWIGGLAEATQELIEMSNADTRIVPAAGQPRNRADLEMQRSMLETVRERIEAMALEGRGIDDMIAAAITAEFDPVYGNPDQFINNAYQGLWWGNRLRGIVA